MKLDTEIIAKFNRANYVVALTGAGISAESGIPTFRGKNGLWSKVNIDEVATADALYRNPKRVWEFLDELRLLISKCKPNPAHKVLAEMEPYFDKFTLITQNIDELHQHAGSRSVIELHGNAWRVKCLREDRVFELRDVPLSAHPPTCGTCGSILRPDIVFFNEPLPADAINAAFIAAETCDLMLIIGTSCVVQPAALLPWVAKQSGATLVEFNTEPTAISGIVDYAYYGAAGKMLPEFWRALPISQK
jgi:NAD-dependent deacetylase